MDFGADLFFGVHFVLTDVLFDDLQYTVTQKYEFSLSSKDVLDSPHVIEEFCESISFLFSFCFFVQRTAATCHPNEQMNAILLDKYDVVICTA